MMKSITGIAVAMLFVGQAYAAEPDICVKLNNAIDSSQKQMADELSDGLLDNSAARETNRQLRINNELQLISMNVSLLSQNKCKLPSEPIVSNVPGYINSAMVCGAERLAGNKNSQNCKRENWTK